MLTQMGNLLVILRNKHILLRLYPLNANVFTEEINCLVFYFEILNFMICTHFQTVSLVVKVKLNGEKSNCHYLRSI